MYRATEIIFKEPKSSWVGNGFEVKNYFPDGHNLLKRFSPFILLDYNPPREFKPRKEPRGVGPHPHRGFETVTFALKGAVEHHDNRGNHGIIYPGDVQWMTAGSGILHKEYHEKDFTENGGLLNMIQLWINLPKKDKMTEPAYQPILNEDMTKVSLDDNGGELTIVSGEFFSKKGPAKTFSPINMALLDLNKAGEVSFDFNKDYNTGFLVISGDVLINDTDNSTTNDFVLFKNEEGVIKVKSLTDDTRLLILNGEPINEPIAAAGPFVMNENEEIADAYQAFYRGEFGPSDF